MLVLKNNEILETTESPNQANHVYEVIRVIDGAPLFFEDHYLRLINSAHFKWNEASLTEETYRQMMDYFIEVMGKENFNIKTLYQPESEEVLLFENPANYPEQDLYETGIKTTVLAYERANPNAKIINLELTDKATKLRKKTGAYEVLLLDEAGRMTEGSRSNIFFIKDGRLYTPGLAQVLPGVTRKHIMEVASSQSLPVCEVDIYAKDFCDYEAAFMSGTSPKILPIRTIDDLVLNSQDHPLLKELMTAFDEHLKADIEQYKNRAKQGKH